MTYNKGTGGRSLVHNIPYPVLSRKQPQQNNGNYHYCSSRDCYFDNNSHTITSNQPTNHRLTPSPKNIIHLIINQKLGEPLQVCPLLGAPKGTPLHLSVSWSLLSGLPAQKRCPAIPPGRPEARYSAAWPRA